MKNKLLSAISITMAVSMLTMTPSLTVSAQDYQDKSAVLKDPDYAGYRLYIKTGKPFQGYFYNSGELLYHRFLGPGLSADLQWRRGGGPRYLWFFWNLCSAGDGR